MTAMMMLDDVSPLERIKLSGQLAAQIAAAATATGMERVRVAGTIAGILAKLGVAAEPAQPERLKNFGWDAVKLADYSLEQLAELRRQVEVEHANPFDEQNRYTENGRPTLHLYDAKGRKKLDALAWAVTYKLQEAKREPSSVTVSPVSEAELIDVGLLRKWGDQWKYRHSMETPSYFTANTKEDAIERATAAYWKASPEQRLTREQRFEKANQDDIASSDDMWRRMGMDALAAMYEKMGGDIKGLQAAGTREFTDGGRRTAPAVAAEGARETAEMRRKLGRYIEWRNEQSAADDTPEKASVAEPEAPAFEIIEHTTGRGKVIRGIVRADLSYAEAKAIDEYTFKKNGGYFIREKHLEAMGLPPAPAAPAEPVDPIRQAELDAEREQQRLQAEADRLANEQARQRQKLEQQVSKLRSVAASTLEKAEQELGRDRLANTSRRAAMAASGIAAAERSRALALTMNNLADAIERGQAQHLAGISSRADVETLTERLNGARYEYERAKGISSMDRERRKHEPITAEEVRYATFPDPKWDSAGANRARILDMLKGKRGGPAIAEKIRYSSSMTAEQVKALRDLLGKKEVDAELGWWNVEQLAKVERLKRAGITNTLELRDALVEFLEFREGARAEDPIAKAERAIIGQKVGIDFFPTPKALAARMADLAGVSEGDRVLEPSAGNGNLADAAKAAGGQVDVIEISSQLRDILTAKGYEVVAHDFDAFTPSEPYDAVIMNPPFSNRRDAEHIMRAFGMLKAGGRLAAIAGEGVFFGTDAKAVAFRKWLDDHGADIEPLGAGTFKDTSLLATTGANARLIVIHK